MSTDGMLDLKQATTDQIVNRYASIKAQMDDMKEDLATYKRELIRRMVADKATKLYHPKYAIARVPAKEYKYSYETAFKIATHAHLLGIPEDLITKAVEITGNPEYVVRRNALEALAAYGGALPELLEECETTIKEDTFTFSLKKE